MPTAAFTTLGCKVNQYETQRILDDFEARGFAITEFNSPADVYVINTCSVTQAAERKSRHIVRKAARQNPDAIVIMTGCYSEMAKIKGESVEEAHLVVPNHRKLHTLEHLLVAYPHLKIQLQDAPTAAPLRPYVRRSRATLKVQDGCNVFCTFCSIPFTRKVMASRPLDELIAEAERLAAQGFRELVVTGVLVGAYGQEQGGAIQDSPDSATPYRWSSDHRYSRPDLADLLLRLTQVEGIDRVRLSSIEPTQVTDRLLDAFAQEPRLCRHLHIPLQSGDSGILRAMNRPYDQDFYLDRCRAASQRIPDLALTADIMVGFPGEDRAAFENTLFVAREAGYARAHLFRYSPRPNTPAALYSDQVSDEEKEARSKELAATCRETQQQFISRYIGRDLEVLVEGKESAARLESTPESGISGNDGHLSIDAQNRAASALGLLCGYSSNYIRVQFTGGSHLIGKLVTVRLTEPALDGAIGEAVGSREKNRV